VTELREVGGGSCAGAQIVTWCELNQSASVRLRYPYCMLLVKSAFRARSLCWETWHPGTYQRREM